MCRLLAVAALMEVMLLLVMREHTYDLPDDTLYKIYNVGLCLIIFSLVELFKTLSCRLLSLRVNAESMFENLQVQLLPFLCLLLRWCGCIDARGVQAPCMQHSA